MQHPNAKDINYVKKYIMYAKQTIKHQVRQPKHQVRQPKHQVRQSKHQVRQTGWQVLFMLDFSLLFKIYRWHFVTYANKADSVVTKRLREQEPAFPFFS